MEYKEALVDGQLLHTGPPECLFVSIRDIWQEDPCEYHVCSGNHLVIQKINTWLCLATPRNK